MPFLVSGRRLGRTVRVRWQDGELDGDEAVILAAELAVADGAPVGLEPVGPFHRPGLEPAWRALLTIRAALDRSDVAVVNDGEDLDVPGAEEGEGSGDVG